MFVRNSSRRKTSGSLSRFSLLHGFSKTKLEPSTNQAEDEREDYFTRDARLRCSTGSIDSRMSHKCVRCGLIVKTRDRVKFGKFIYHRNCFSCSVCKVVLNPKEYRVTATPKKATDEQNLYCDSHKQRSNDSENVDLFDLICRTQNTRIDDQRCELPGGIQKCQSVSQLTSPLPITSDHDKVKEMLKGKGPYPQLLDVSGYWVEGFCDKRQSDSDPMLRSADLKEQEYELLKNDAVNYYKEFFYTQEHQNYITQDDTFGPVIVSVKREIHADAGKLYRVIVRTRLSTVHELIKSEENSEPSISSLTKLCYPNISTCKFYPVTSLEASTHIKNFDDRFINRNFKFGVIYQSKGQTREEELFSNRQTTPAFSEFLEQIGEKVSLQGFDGFRGGLDTIKGQTGAESIHTDYEGREIMFHVSTLLPYTDGDTQQLQKKRHIGNDIVAVVFQEESTPFIPNSIASQFLHSYIIIQPVDPCTENTRYKISVAARSDVPRFEPHLPKSKVVKKDQLRDFVLTKLLNAEYACHISPQFSQKMERTRIAYLSELYDELFKSTLDSWCGINTPSSDKTTVSMFDSFKKMALKKISENPTINKKMNSLTPDGAKTPVQDQRIHKLSHLHKKGHSDVGLSNTASWDRNSTLGNRTWAESTSMSSFRSKGSYNNDNNSLHSNSPKDRSSGRNVGRSASPTSLGSYGVDDEDGFIVHNHDSDTGVGSMSPTETPSSTWDPRGSAAHRTHPSNQCCNQNGETPDLDYISLLKKEIVSLEKVKSQQTNEITSLKGELNDFKRRDSNYRTDLKEKTKHNLRLQHQMDELKTLNVQYRNELSRLQATVAGMSGEEIV